MKNSFVAIRKAGVISAGVLLISAACFFNACGDDSSSNATPITPVAGISSSGMQGNDTLPSQNIPSEPPVGELSSSSELIPVTPNDTTIFPPADTSSTVVPVDTLPADTTPSQPQITDPVTDPEPSDPSAPVTSAVTLDATPDADGFYDVGDIYKALPATYKLVFVLRHAEREKSEDQESQLTAVGVQQALDVGKRLAGGDANFYYASTDFIRTRETCNNIAKGRGEVGNETVTWSGIDGGYFLKTSSDEFDDLVGRRGGSWKNMSQWAYGDKITNNYVAPRINDYLYDLFDRGAQFINEVILENLPKWKRVNVLVSHDILLEPLIVYVSNRTVDLNFAKSGRWVNYLSGIAVVVNEEGAVGLYPVRGNEVGWMVVEKVTTSE
ncbi:MAG: histidine phosphatase family protein [Fibrobacter sp.]|nr:histidine phosphatase family protein [Fibrobacter sp.]